MGLLVEYCIGVAAYQDEVGFFIETALRQRCGSNPKRDVRST